MSNIPPYGYAAPPRVKRPTSATVFGVLNYVIGSLSLCGAILVCLSLVVQNSFDFGPDMQDSALEELQDSGQVFATVSLLFWIADAVLLFAGGAGLFAIRPYGRTCTLFYAYVAFVYLVIKVVHHFMIVVPALNDAIAQLQNNADVPAEIQDNLVMMVSLQKNLVWIGWILGLIYPIFILIYMNRRPILELYKPGYTAPRDPQSQFPVQRPAADPRNPYASPFD